MNQVIVAKALIFSSFFYLELIDIYRKKTIETRIMRFTSYASFISII